MENGRLVCPELVPTTRRKERNGIVRMVERSDITPPREKSGRS